MSEVERQIKHAKKFADKPSKMNAELASSIINDCYKQFRKLGVELEQQIAELQKSIIQMQGFNDKCKGSDELAQKYGREVIEHCNKALLASKLIKMVANKF